MSDHESFFTTATTIAADLGLSFAMYPCGAQILAL